MAAMHAGHGAEAFEVREVPVFREHLTRETIPLRFYEGQPHVAYVSPSDFYRLMLPQGTLEQERGEDGIWHLTSHTGADPLRAMVGGLGGEATVDVSSGTLTSPDMAAFTNVMSLVQDGIANCYLDGAAYARVAGCVPEGGPEPQTIDFGRYGIVLHEDDDGVYLPFQTLSMLVSDLHYNYASFNGKTVYVNDDTSYPQMSERDAGYFDPILGSLERPADLAEFGYAHLCLIVDYLYGRPGAHLTCADELERFGLDGMLGHLGEPGREIRAGLASREVARYLQALDGLGALLYDGGHTVVSASRLTDLASNGRRRPLYESYLGRSRDFGVPIASLVWEHDERVSADYDVVRAYRMLHDDAYGGRSYVVDGDTALIALDSFGGIDFDRWRDYFAGVAAMPSPIEPYDEEGDVDSAAVFLDGIERAAADPSVRNVVLDLSNNAGGSLDVVALVRAIVSGDASFRFENTLTGTVEREDFEIDANLDGTFDERDTAPAHPDLTFAVLTGPVTFSCGSVAAAYLKDDGILVMGTRTRGGSCAVEMGVLADGIAFPMSSWRARTVNADGEDIDGGVAPDVDLVERFGRGRRRIELEQDRVAEVDDYDAFFDVALLGRVMDEWYGAEALDTAA